MFVTAKYGPIGDALAPHILPLGDLPDLLGDSMVSDQRFVLNHERFRAFINVAKSSHLALPEEIQLLETLSEASEGATYSRVQIGKSARISNDRVHIVYKF